MDNSLSLPAHPPENPSADRLSASLWSQKHMGDERAQNPSDTEGMASKLEREARVLGAGLTQGFVDTADESLADKVGTAFQVVSAAAIGKVTAALHGQTGWKGLAGRSLVIGLGVSTAYDLVASGRIGRLADVVEKTWQSPNNQAAEIKQAKDLGHFAFDTALSMAGAGIGSKLSFTKLSAKVTEFNKGVGESMNSLLGRNELAPAYAGTEASLPKQMFQTAENDGSKTAMFSRSSRGDDWGDSSSTDSREPSRLAEQFRKDRHENRLLNPPPHLHQFSPSTRRVLLPDEFATMSDRMTAGSKYHSYGLKPEYGSNREGGLRDIVPYSDLPRLLNPEDFLPKKVDSLSEMGQNMLETRRAQLARNDETALNLRDSMMNLAAQGARLTAEGAQARANLTSLAAKAELYDSWAGSAEGDARSVVEAENAYKALQDQRKDINILRLEQARNGTKLKKIDTQGEAALPPRQDGTRVDLEEYRRHLNDQHVYLEEHIVERENKVGSVADSTSPIGRARYEFEKAKQDAESNALTWGPPSEDRSETDWNRQTRLREWMEQLYATQRTINQNELAQKENAIRFSESVHSYRQRLDDLVNPKPAGDSALFGSSHDTGEREQAWPEPARDVSGEAAALIGDDLKAQLKERAISQISTSKLQNAGLLARAVDKVHDNSAFVFFKDGKPIPLALPEEAHKPAMINTTAQDFDFELWRLGFVEPDGYAVISPKLNADGSLMRRVDRNGRSGLDREVSVVGGNVPDSVGIGTNLGKIFAMVPRRS